jgi:hypothetical protein
MTRPFTPERALFDALLDALWGLPPRKTKKAKLEAAVKLVSATDKVRKVVALPVPAPADQQASPVQAVVGLVIDNEIITGPRHQQALRGRFVPGAASGSRRQGPVAEPHTRAALRHRSSRGVRTVGQGERLMNAISCDGWSCRSPSRAGR